MITGEAMATAVCQAGFTHVVWIPDSHLGTWDAALASMPQLSLIRPTREGEAVAIAAGLILGGKQPLVMIQCTGFFEAGDAVRNVVHDLGLPLKMIVGVRSWRQRQTTADNCPALTEPLVNAWKLPSEWVDPFMTVNVDDVMQRLANANHARVLLWGE